MTRDWQQGIEIASGDWYVTYEGKTYTVTSEALAENYQDRVRYFAYGTDANGNDVRISWETTAEWDEMITMRDPDYWDCEPDEADACDWEHPIAVELY